MKTKLVATCGLAAIFLAGCASEDSGRRENQARLAAEAKVTEADALQTALGQVPDGVVKESELEKEHGRLVWSFDITQPDSKDVLEVAVDAVTGKIVSMETESAKQESKEKD